jgi:hypothetical protein
MVVLVSCQPAFDEAHEVIGVSLAMIDVTEQKRAEEALRGASVQGSEGNEG